MTAAEWLRSKITNTLFCILISHFVQRCLIRTPIILTLTWMCCDFEKGFFNWSCCEFPKCKRITLLPLITNGKDESVSDGSLKHWSVIKFLPSCLEWFHTLSVKKQYYPSVTELTCLSPHLPDAITSNFLLALSPTLSLPNGQGLLIIRQFPHEHKYDLWPLVPFTRCYCFTWLHFNSALKASWGASTSWK